MRYLSVASAADAEPVRTTHTKQLLRLPQPTPPLCFYTEHYEFSPAVFQDFRRSLAIFAITAFVSICHILIIPFHARSHLSHESMLALAEYKTTYFYILYFSLISLDIFVMRAISRSPHALPKRAPFHRWRFLAYYSVRCLAFLMMIIFASFNAFSFHYFYICRRQLDRYIHIFSAAAFSGRNISSASLSPHECWCWIHYIFFHFTYNMLPTATPQNSKTDFTLIFSLTLHMRALSLFHSYQLFIL